MKVTLLFIAACAFGIASAQDFGEGILDLYPSVFFQLLEYHLRIVAAASNMVFIQFV